MSARPFVDPSADESVSPLVRKGAAWAWRLLVIFGAVFAALWVVVQVEVIVVPVALATLAAALLMPAVDFLDRRGAPRGGSVALILLGGLALVGGMLSFVVSQFIEGTPGLVDQVTRSIDGVRRWLIDGPLAPLPCLSRTAYQRCPDCTDEETCRIRRTFADVFSGYLQIIDSLTLADLMRSDALSLQVIADA